MLFQDKPIQRRLVTIILLASAVMLLLTCVAFFLYDYVTLRRSTVQHLSTLARVIANNSTASLAFDNEEDAIEILAALKAEQNISLACLYDQDGRLFSRYPTTLPPEAFPSRPEKDGYRFNGWSLVAYEPVVERGKTRLGTLFIRSDLKNIHSRFRLYAIMFAFVLVASLLVAYILSKVLGNQILRPVLALTETARAISDRNDYSVRATKLSDDEVGLLTDSFNQMLTRIHQQTEALKESEEHVQKLNQELEERVIDRTAQLQAANKELEAFSYSVSHDLRAPLRHIHGFTGLLRKKANNLDEKSLHYLDSISDASKQMGELIDALLLFSRMGRVEMRQSTVNLEELVKETISKMQLEIQSKKVLWKCETLPEVKADRVLMQQAFTNLLSNAVKYSAPRDPSIIEVGTEDTASSETVVYVRDNGVGFDMKYVNRLFGVFQRLHSADDFEGTGIGLANVARIIHRHGGRVWAEGKLNEGATFYFSLPK